MEPDPTHQATPVTCTSLIRVFYDGACPRCRRDRARYEELAGDRAQDVEWVDITGREAELRALGIDPHTAMLELHVQDKDGQIQRELDAYYLLMSRVPQLRPLAWLFSLPGIRALASSLYRWSVRRRLKRSGRLPE